MNTRIFFNSNALSALSFILALLALSLSVNPHKRLAIINGIHCEAWHIEGPGYVEYINRELKEPLEIDTLSGKPKLNDAAVALLAFKDAQQKLIDGKWYLYNPEERHRQWTWLGVSYRIGPWKKAKDYQKQIIRNIIPAVTGN